MKSSIKPPILFFPVIVVLSFYLFYAFSSGKIIPIPHGTREGGIIMVIGYFVILITMILMSVIFGVIMRKNQRKKGDNA